MEELLERALKGDIDSYGKLIEMIAPELTYIAKLKLKNNEDVSEAIQETFINSFKYLKTLKDKRKFKSWIIRILNTECNRIYLAKTKELNLLSKIIHFADPNKFDNSIEEFENDENFANMLSVLNKNEKTIITLYYKYEYSTSEIAYILKMNINTVKSQLLRAKTKLEKNMKEVKYNESRK